MLVLLISGCGISSLKAQTTASFNFSLSAHTVSGWTNVAGDPSTGVRSATSGSIQVSSIATANWAPYNSVAAYDGGGMSGASFFPSAVMANMWFQYSAYYASYNAAVPQLEISGLSIDSVYTLQMTTSFSPTTFNFNPTRYTVTGVTVYGYSDVNGNSNTTDGAVFHNIAPDANGKIHIYVNTASGSNTAGISGLQITSGHTATPVPSVSITHPNDGDVLAEEGNVNISATASETGGAIAKVEFYADTTKIGEDSTAPYSMVWNSPDEGHYTLKARAIDGTGNTNTASINISIESLSSFWSMTGNIHMNPDSNFVGNVDSVRLAFRTKNIERMSISPTGNVGIGAINPTAQLHTTGTVRFAGLASDTGNNSRVLVSDTSGNIFYRNSSALGATVGDGLGQTSSGSLTLGDSIPGPGPHSFTANRYQYLNNHLYSIGGTVNDPVTKPVFRVYDNGNLTVGTTMDTSVSTKYQSGMRYYSKLGLLQIGGSDKIDTTLNKIVYGPYQGAGIVMNSDEPNIIKGYIMNTFFTGDLNVVDTLTRMEDCLVGAEHTTFGGSLTKSTISGWGLTLGGDISNSIISGDAHTLNKIVYSDAISGTLQSNQDTSSVSVISGYANKFGGIAQFVTGGHMVNKTPFGSVMGNTNVDFTSLGYTGWRGIAIPSTIAQYPLLAVGNGSANDGSIQSNALTMLFNGRTQINTTGYTHALSQSDVTPKAAFEVVSTNSGVLLPKLTTVQRNAIISGDLQNGLLLYNTDSASFQYYNGGTWKSMGTGIAASGWTSTGNSGTTPGTNFIGTTDSQRLVFKTNGVENMTILPGGGVGIGTSTLPASDARLAVNGIVYTKKMKVTQSGWPDYVFKKGYQLPSLAQVEQYINQQGHLPGVISAKEVEKKGLDLGDNQAALLKKIEELTLYLIEEHKKVEAQDREIEQLKNLNKKLDQQQKQIDELKALLIQQTTHK